MQKFVDSWLFDRDMFRTWTYVWFPLSRPRTWLCDQGVWHCSDHPRTAHSRLAIRKRLRAKRIKSYEGWSRAELERMLQR